MLVEPPVELPVPVDPLLLPVLGELVLEPDELPLPMLPEELPVPLLPLVDPPAAPVDPDLLKCASHSERETCPSLFLSTSEKLGADVLPDDEDVPPADDGEEEDDEDGLLDEPLDDPVALLPVADGDDAEGLLLDDEDDCATASVDSAKRTAAAVTLRVFRIWRSPVGRETASGSPQAMCPDADVPGPISEDQLTPG